jgi:hypothetical protein
MQEAARVKAVLLPILKASSESEIGAAFASLAELYADGLVVEGNPPLLSVLRPKRQPVGLAAIWFPRASKRFLEFSRPTSATHRRSMQNSVKA